MIWRRLLGVVAALTLLVGVSACAVQWSGGVHEAASSSSPSASASDYEFSWRSVSSDEATVYVPVFVTGAEVAVSLVTEDAFPAEVCRVRLLAEDAAAQASGGCELMPVQRNANGTLHGLLVKLTGLTPGHYVYDVQVWPIARLSRTGAWCFDCEPPAVDRMSLFVR